MIEPFLIKYNIPTYLTQIQTLLPNPAVQQIFMGKNMPSTVGLIYGIFVYTDGVLPADNSTSLITTSNAENLYLTLKVGNTNYVENFRLDHLVYYNETNATVNNTPRYYSVNIPYNIELDKSYYLNPSGISDNAILLNLLYIDKVGMKILQQKGVIGN